MDAYDRIRQLVIEINEGQNLKPAPEIKGTIDMGFRDGIGGKWLVAQNIDGDEVVNSCHTIEDARQRAEDLVRQSPNLTATIYKAVEKAEAEHSPIKIKTLT